MNTKSHFKTYCRYGRSREESDVTGSGFSRFSIKCSVCNGAMTKSRRFLDLQCSTEPQNFDGAIHISSRVVPNTVLKPPSKWSAFSPSSLCLGHELAVTGMQLVQAYSAIANGGLLVKPKLIKRISSQDNEMKEEFETEVVRRVLSPELAKTLREMLMGVVEGGTGRLAKVKDYTAGGKTSTAQKIEPSGVYSTTKVVCSFIGMVPAMNPKIVLLVVLNRTKGDDKTLSGGLVTAEPFSKIADRVMKYMRIPPDRPQNKIIKDIAAYNVEKNNTFAQIEVNSDITDIVPNLIGKSLKDAIQSVEKSNLKAIFDGHGIVVSQQPRPGSPIPARKIMKVTLSPDYRD